MLIDIETTPNPATLKFLPGRSVMGNNTPLNFSSRDEVEGRSPLAEKLFSIAEVKLVFLGHDFVSVTKADNADWSEVRPLILAALTSFLESGQAFFIAQNSPESQDVSLPPEEEEVISRIKDLLDTRVRPAVAGDGGDIVFRNFKDGIVYLTMHGACAGCPSSKATLRHGVETMLRHYVPEVSGVEQVEG
ncbi:NifU family protein [Aristophania vespae]|uniref:NifU family protein n=1 Tax=Aristophania vespae TaxID=2697033 RepID=A0A6P1NES1_9PROT|nr:NifU family protein [Aristophania vespae]QHI94984.1 NifU family protein [Aristophania vespae]